MKNKIQDLLDREDIRLASNLKRVIAFVIDLFLMSSIFMVIHIDALPSTQISYEENIRLTSNILNSFMWEYVLLKISYESFFVWRYGGSIGKILLNLKIIDISLPDNPTLLQSISRSILKFIGEMLFYLSFFFAFADTFRQSLHDKIAQTIVIDTKRR